MKHIKCKNDYEIINEDTIDRYDYGVYPIESWYSCAFVISEISELVNTENPVIIQRLINDYNIDASISVGKKCIEIVDRYKYFDYNQSTYSYFTRNFNIYDLGDYCYCLMVSGRNKYYILDEFESVIENLKEIWNIE